MTKNVIIFDAMSKNVINLVPVAGFSHRQGRPGATRWEDDLEAFAQHHGFKWETCTRDRDAWESWESKFVDWRVRADGEDTM